MDLKKATKDVKEINEKYFGFPGDELPEIVIKKYPKSICHFYGDLYLNGGNIRFAENGRIGLSPNAIKKTVKWVMIHWYKWKLGMKKGTDEDFDLICRWLRVGKGY